MQPSAASAAAFCMNSRTLEYGGFSQTTGGPARWQGTSPHRTIKEFWSNVRNVRLVEFSSVAAASSVNLNSAPRASYRSGGVVHSSDARENNTGLVIVEHAVAAAFRAGVNRDDSHALSIRYSQMPSWRYRRVMLCAPNFVFRKSLNLALIPGMLATG